MIFVFLDLAFSLSILTSSSIHFPAGALIAFVKAECNSIVHIYHVFYIHPLMVI